MFIKGISGVLRNSEVKSLLDIPTYEVDKNS